MRKAFTIVLWLCSLNLYAEVKQLRIMPLGDSITAGYTDNSAWKHPFEYGYRAPLYKLLSEAKIDFKFVGESPEPMNKKFGDPTHGGTVFPKIDLKALGQDGHRGYGGWSIGAINKNVAHWINQDKPDLILLMIGINGISAKSPEQLDKLVQNIFKSKAEVKLIVAQITPYSKYRKVLVDYNTYIRENLVPNYKAKGRNISTVDLYTDFLNDKNDQESIDSKKLSNRINHPTNELYAKMAQAWFEVIKKIVKN